MKINIELTKNEAEKHLVDSFNQNGAYDAEYCVKILSENLGLSNYQVAVNNKIALIKFLRQVLLWIDERGVPHSVTQDNPMGYISLGNSKRLVEEYIETFCSQDK